jgi:hypothetical protein
MIRSVESAALPARLTFNLLTTMSHTCLLLNEELDACAKNF